MRPVEVPAQLEAPAARVASASAAAERPAIRTRKVRVLMKLSAVAGGGDPATRSRIAPRPRWVPLLARALGPRRGSRDTPRAKLMTPESRHLQRERGERQARVGDIHRLEPAGAAGRRRERAPPHFDLDPAVGDRVAHPFAG